MLQKTGQNRFEEMKEKFQKAKRHLTLHRDVCSVHEEKINL